MAISWTGRLLILLLVSGLAVLALFKPTMFLGVEALAILLAAGFAAYLFPSIFLGIAIASLALSPENLIGPEFGGVDTRALHRLVVLLALGINVLRFGIVPRLNPPLVALAVIFMATLAFADTHPRLTQFQMGKSLIGLMFPFFFISVNYNPKAIPRLLLAVALMPALSIVCAAVLDLGGLRGDWAGIFKTDVTGAWRLGAMSYAAYLGFFGYIAFFVCLFEAIVSNKRYFFGLAVMNLVIVFLTGTRAPMVLVVFLGLLAVVFTTRKTITYSTKTGLFLVGITIVSSILVMFWPQVEARMFTAAGGVAINLSGRALIWSLYLDAIDVNVWFGRGIGTGAILLRGERTVTTVAAHNEYLRILADAGIFGLITFITGFVLWVRSDLRWMDRDERLLMMSFFLTLALYSLTSNTLSSAPSLVAFFAVAILFARARHAKLSDEHAEAGH